MSDATIWLTVHYLHLIAMAFFVGGQLVFLAAVVPVERRYPEAERMKAIARRFGYGSLVALIVLASSGSAMATHEHAWADPTLQLKLGVVALVIFLAVAHLVRPRLHVLQALILLASLTIVWLGLNVAHR
jgi:putative copper export protein